MNVRCGYHKVRQHKFLNRLRSFCAQAENMIKDEQQVEHHHVLAADSVFVKASAVSKDQFWVCLKN